MPETNIPPGIPIVDLSPILGPFPTISDKDYEQVVTSLGNAMSGIGFAYIINHGINMSDVENVYSVSRSFFLNLSPSQKAVYRKVNPPENFHGYTRPGAELLNEGAKNSEELREVWDMWGWWGPNKDRNAPGARYPDKQVPGFSSAFETLRPQMDNLSLKLFHLMGKYLGLEDQDFFVNRHKNLGDLSIPTQTQMRSMFYYNLDPDPSMNRKLIEKGAIRCGEHSDWGSITLLFQDDVGGLEVSF
jgi:isopenicillin N synthase-like dioxygenase